MTKGELQKLFEETVQELHGSSEVVGYAIAMNTGLSAEVVLDVSIKAIRELRDQALPLKLEDLSEDDLERQILAMLASAFIAGTVFGCKIQKNSEC